MPAAGDTLKEIQELFGQQPKSSDRVKFVMEADKLFLAEMDGEVARTSLLAFQHSLRGKYRESGQQNCSSQCWQGESS